MSYTKPVSDIIKRFGLLHHSYADDIQLYIVIKTQYCVADNLSDIKKCVSELCNMSLLKLFSVPALVPSLTDRT